MNLNLLRKNKAVPITVPTVGTVPEGYEVKSTSATPTQLTVTGREELIDSITDIQTEPVDIIWSLQKPFKVPIT